MSQKFIYQPPDDPKSGDAVAKMMVWGGLFVGALAVFIYLYETVTGWYNATATWALEMWAYIASFWPF
ncbi:MULTISPECIES: hypothetical protein [Agrobacterium]|uniref:Uncharacterized protein n=1 Tax=Agrobacterium larrymoorei TaxID=160699 RepID=A0ABX8TDM4_9HYPH|nr:hypothetical protein [Agrobacterium larrymoorei]NSZ10085.1 hypothetical protein [Agrobacterium tumefaciens]QYA10815.1 hypothetical protein J5285_26030 [Agrobacterium larrymoorei]